VKAVILAAGQGTRLRSISASKPLAPVLGTPLIERVVDATARAGISEFLVVTGYEAGPLEAFLAGLAPRRGVKIETVRNTAWQAANGLSVLAAAPRLDGPFLLLMADHLFDPEIVGALVADAAGRPGLTLAVDRRLANPLVDMDDVTRVETAADGGIVRIGKGITPFDAFDTGLFVATASLVEAIRADVDDAGAGSLSAGVQRLAAAGQAFTYDIGDRFWLDVDDAVAFGHAEREEARAGLRR
jgi:1L-myo-inositol 1-phosphate cytidylyltransferase